MFRAACARLLSGLVSYHLSYHKPAKNATKPRLPLQDFRNQCVGMSAPTEFLHPTRGDVRPYEASENFPSCVGGDAHIAPWVPTNSPGTSVKNGAHCRVDVGIDPYGHDCGTQKTPSGWMAFFHGAGYGNTPAALPPPCRLGNCFDLRPKPSVFHTAAGLAPGIAGRSNHGFVAGPLQQKSAPIFEMGADFWSGVRESNPPLWLGKRPFYR